jgi:NodT family efflux transporter outer membrane factor (OMF) lipoprotein
VATVALALGAACAPVGPKYTKPAAPAVAAWETPAPWRPSDPKDAIPKGAWWTVFRDDELGALEAKAIAANQTLRVAVAQYEQARALSALTLSSLYPHVSISAQAQSQQLSGTRAGGSGEAVVQNSFVLPLSVSYEVDLFGKRLHNIEASQASLEASAAETENVRLVITAELAADYFTIRRLDSEIGILARTVESLDKALALIRARHDGGISSGLDVAQEETLVSSTRTQATLLRQQRDQLESAIAVLTGQPAPGYHLPSRGLSAIAPAIDTGLPSDLLERRPDIAEAERQMAVANARIGVARTAFYPSLNLLGTGGWQTASILKLFDWPSVIWSAGATAAQDLFSGGAREAQLKFAEAGYDASVANYRESVLNALSEVRDDLEGIGVLNDARTTQAQAVEAATRALDIATSRYTGGLASALDVVSAQQALLASERLAVQLDGERLVTTVLLVKALGGGWK